MDFEIISEQIQSSHSICVQNCPKHQNFSLDRLVFTRSNSSEDSDSSTVDSDQTEEIIEENTQKLFPSEFYHKFVARTEEECKNELMAPQKSEKWLEARKMCITASQFGAAAGMSPYQTPDELVSEKIWKTFSGNAATEWGNTHEPHAKEAFCSWFTRREGVTDFQFLDVNLIKFADEPWIAVSPDGIIRYTQNGEQFVDLVEFKCPAYLRETRGHPYTKHPQDTPPYYEAQMQGIMGYLNEHSDLFKPQKCWFVVWQPRQTWITLHNFNEEYYSNLHDKLKRWYFTKFLPALCYKHNGQLLHGMIEPKEIIYLDQTT